MKWKRLCCRKVTVLSETETGTIFVLDVGHAVEFDWTWEGAVAFRPLVLKEFAENPEALFVDDTDDVDIKDPIVWSGEILEVDETNGRIDVCVSNPEYPSLAIAVRFDIFCSLDCCERFQGASGCLLPESAPVSSAGSHSANFYLVCSHFTN